MRVPGEVEPCWRESTVVVVGSRMLNDMAEAQSRATTGLALGSSGEPIDCTLGTFVSGQNERIPRGARVVAGCLAHPPRSSPQAAPLPPRRPGHGSPCVACGSV